MAKLNYGELYRAVRDFNKTIRELQRANKDLDLPSYKDYKYVKQGIQTKQELNVVINRLKKFQIKSAEEVIELAKRQLDYDRVKALKNLQSQKRAKIRDIKKKQGSFGMQDKDLMILKGEIKAVRQATISSEKLDRIRFLASAKSNQNLTKLKIYKENMKKAIAQNFDLLEDEMLYKQTMAKINELDDSEFYELVKDDENIRDAKTYYVDKSFQKLKKLAMKLGVYGIEDVELNVKE